jgi:hypothetical protein
MKAALIMAHFAVGNSTVVDDKGAFAPRTLGCALGGLTVFKDRAFGARGGSFILLTGEQTSRIAISLSSKKRPSVAWPP